MLAQGLGVSVDTACMRVFVGLPVCVRARVAVVCSYNHKSCVIDFTTTFRTFCIVANSLTTMLK